MSAYRSTAKGTVQFDGQTIRYELKRITTEDAMILRNLKVYEAPTELPKYVVAMDALLDADGKEIAREIVFSEFYFTDLREAMLLTLLETGRIPREKVDPSVGSSSSGSADEVSRDR